MLRSVLALMIAIAPLMILISTTGCEPEVKSVQKTERVQESEPQMTSPGQPVVE